MQDIGAGHGLVASLGWIDLTALAVLVVFFVLGLFHGLVWQISRILTLVLAYVGSGMYGAAVAGRIHGLFPADVPAEVPLYIAYVLVFLVVLVVISVIAYFIEKLVQRSHLSFYNRIGGGALGFLTGGCVVLAMLAVLLMFFGSPSVVQASKKSWAVKASKQTLALLGNRVPEALRKPFGLVPKKKPGPGK